MDTDVLLDEVRLRIAAATGRAASYRRRRFPDAVSLESVTRLEDVIDSLVQAGGKMLRPQVAALGYQAVAGRAPLDDHSFERVARLGAALELLHVFGLLQDDVMDQSADRRGARAAHEVMAGAARTRAGCAPQVAARFGESIAVLAGDLAFALAGREMRGMPPAVLDAWDDTVLELVQGQRLDMVHALEGRFDTADTQWVAMAKSGGYTIARPLELGARLADPSAAPPPWLTGYGYHVAMVFALTDDLLGIWGDPDRTGKPVGDDLRQGKPSTVIGIADTMLPEPLTPRLHSLGAVPDEDTITRALADLEQHHVRLEVEERIKTHLGHAEQALHQAPDDLTYHALTHLATSIADRSS